MEIVLTGRNFSAQEASEWGLVSRVSPRDQSVVDEAVKVAGKVASKSRIAVQAAKEGVNSGASVVCTGTRPPTRGTRCGSHARETYWTLLRTQPTSSRSRRACTSSAASSTSSSRPCVLFPSCRNAVLVADWQRCSPQNDQKIGMKAFAEKQKPKWTHS